MSTNKNIKKTKDKIKYLEEKKVSEDKKETSNEFVEEESKVKEIVVKILNIVLWIVLFAWMAICLIDFFNVKNEKDPMFCISKDSIEYDDGNVDVCVGPGYKVFNYERDSYKGIEFTHLFAKDRSAGI